MFESSSEKGVQDASDSNGVVKSYIDPELFAATSRQILLGTSIVGFVIEGKHLELRP